MFAPRMVGKIPLRTLLLKPRGESIHEHNIIRFASVIRRARRPNVKSYD